VSIAAPIALASAVLAVYVAALSRRFSLAPGWRDQRWFALAALTVAVFAALDVSVTSHWADAAVIWCSRGQVLMAGIHVFAWIRYTDERLGARPGRLRAVLDRVPLALGLSALVPGAVFRDAVRSHTFAPLGLTYRDVVPTLFGEVALAVLLGSFVVLAGRWALAWRRGLPQAGLHLASLAFLIGMAANDELVTLHVLSTPYLIDLGFIGPVAAIAYCVTARFARDARALALLREDLERLVEERTEALGQAQERLLQSQAQLLRSEKLAAVGQLAAGVAHEVNNPAAAVAANLRYLAECCRGSERWPEDALECLDESTGSMERIARIVRQLLDAGRLAAAPVAVEPVSLARVVRESIRTSQARCGERARIVADVGEDLMALANGDALVQVLVNLILNGAQAIPEGRRGLVTVRGEQAPGRVRLLVEDNGAGMAPEVLRRAFEPFYTTKPFGLGTGLGLAVSRGLLQGLGGDLRFEGAAGGGTRAVVDLPEAPPQRRASDWAAPPGRSPEDEALPRRRRLVVDDDPAVLRSFERMLRGRYRIAVAADVDQGLARLAAEPFDAVLCDVMMADGGGERLHREVCRRAPEQARRLLFMTGGATSEEARRFLADRPEALLEKPLDVETLAAAIERLPTR
jgi:signal transduction histidine kinase